jgi:hypothetical protein
MHFPQHRKKRMTKSKPVSPQTVWEIVFFGTICILALEFLASSFFFLKTTRALEAAPVLGIDASLQKIQALHEQVEAIGNTIDTREGKLD